jgi:hypothetical protein
MTKGADLQRVQADLLEAQAEIETAATVEGSFADSLKFGFNSLLAAVGTLFAASNKHERKLTEHDRQLKIMIAQITELQKQIHGLKVSRGKAIAAKQKAMSVISNAKNILDQISLH